MVRSFVKHMVRGTMLDDAPWDWSGAWTKDMPEFFSEVQTAYPGSNVYGNVYDTLDTTPVKWHVTDVSVCARLCLCAIVRLCQSGSDA